MKPLKNTLYFICILLIVSCSKKLDFDQLDDYVLTPVYTSSLGYFTILPIQFFDETGTVEQTEISDLSGFRVFENTFLKNNLVKLDFNVEIKNEFDRNFRLNVEFLDDNDNITHKFSTLNINANNLNYTNLEEIDVLTNLNIKNTTQVKVNAILESSTEPLNSASTSEFEFKSAVTIYIQKDF
jgi:hypothetical protein